MKIEENNKAKFTKEIEKLLKQTRACQDIELTYGSLKWIPLTTWEPGAQLKEVYDKETDGFIAQLFKPNFTPSERTLNNTSDPREFVMIKVDGRTFYQSVEGSSYWGMILDIIKRMDKERV